MSASTCAVKHVTQSSAQKGLAADSAPETKAKARRAIKAFMVFSSPFCATAARNVALAPATVTVPFITVSHTASQ